MCIAVFISPNRKIYRKIVSLIESLYYLSFSIQSHISATKFKTSVFIKSNKND